MLTFGEKVKLMRQLNGWNQTTLAQKSGIHQSTISQYEANLVQAPDVKQLRKLAETLECSIDWLVR